MADISLFERFVVIQPEYELGLIQIMCYETTLVIQQVIIGKRRGINIVCLNLL